VNKSNEVESMPEIKRSQTFKLVRGNTKFNESNIEEDGQSAKEQFNLQEVKDMEYTTDKVTNQTLKADETNFNIPTM